VEIAGQKGRPVCLPRVAVDVKPQGSLKLRGQSRSLFARYSLSLIAVGSK
jgi:hypothetical protein